MAGPHLVEKECAASDGGQRVMMLCVGFACRGSTHDVKRRVVVAAHGLARTMTSSSLA